jgi:hypothetical protein
MKRTASNSWMVAALALVLIVVLSGCNGGSGATPPIGLSLSPSGAQTVDQAETKTFTATVSHDSSNKGVIWTLTQNGNACSPGCGTISPTNTQSGQPATYAAPTAVHANLELNVTATSVADTTKSNSVSTTAVPPPALNNPATLPAATIGKSYSYQLTEAGGVPPFTWKVSSGSLPQGLTLDSSTGLISGTPAAMAAAAAQSAERPEAAAQDCFTVQVTDSGNPPVPGTSQECINVSPGQSPSQLAFVQQPANVAAGSSITPAITVAIEDASGNIVTTATNVVSLQINANPAGGTLSGTVASTAVAGVATFSADNINKAGNGYTLTAKASGLSSATSTTFNVTAGVASQLAFVEQPTSVAANSSITPAVTVAVEDAFGNIVTTATNSVTIAIGTNPSGGTLAGTATENAVNGIASFSNLNINKPGDGYTLTATTTGPTSATSGTFPVTGGNGTGLTINITSSGNFNMQKGTNTNPTNSDTFNIPAILTATGGTPPYTWSADSLPDSTFSIATDASGKGVISTIGGYWIGPFTSNVTVKDSTGASVSKDVPLTIGCVLADYTNGVGGGVHNNNAVLSGTFAYMVSGFLGSTFPVMRAGAFTGTDQGEDPNTLLGMVTGGVEDSNEAAGPQKLSSSSSRFCVDLDGSGSLLLDTSNGLPGFYRIRGALPSLLGPSAAQTAQLLEFDGVHGSGELRLQDPATQFGTGNYVFGFSGRDSNGYPAAIAGDFSINGLQPPVGSGGTNGEEDFNDAGLFGAVAKGNVKYTSVQTTFTADAGNAPFSRYEGKIKATNASVPELDFAAYLVPGRTSPGAISNKTAELFVVVSLPQAVAGGAVPGMSGRIHLENVAANLTQSQLNALLKGPAVYYRIGVEAPSPASPTNVTGSAATVGYIEFNPSFSRFSEDSDIGGSVSSTGTLKYTDTHQVSSTGRVTSSPTGPAIGYLWDTNTAIWFDNSANAGIGELTGLSLPIFEETQPAKVCQGPSGGRIVFTIPAAADESLVGVGSVTGAGFACPNPPATNFGLQGDLAGDIVGPGLKFNLQTAKAGTLSGLPYTISEIAPDQTSNGLSRFTVGDCPDSSKSGQPCFVGYGYGSLFSQILIETNLGPNDPSGFAPGPNKFPVVIVW